MPDKSIFDTEEFKPYKDAWYTRLKELTYRASYYDGSVYRKQAGMFWSLGPRVAKEVKPLFLPLSRAVDIDAGIIPGGWEFPENDPKREIWEAARDALFDASNWDVNGVLFVHYGSTYGVSGLRVADVRGEGGNRVMVQPANPTQFMLVYGGAYADAPTMALCIESKSDGAGSYEYAEVITPETIRTFRDGQPFGYDGREPEYPNTQGIIPIVECVHLNDGTDLGECTYQKAIPMLNEVNEMGTRLAGVIRKNEDPQWITSGAEPSDLERGSDIMWFMPQGAETKAIVPTLDIPGVLEFIREIKEGVKESLPELAFDDLRKSAQIATQTLEIQLMELIIKIKRVRPNYDRALTTAMQIAGLAAKEMGLSDIAPLADPELILDPERSVLPLLPKDAIELEMAQIELDNMRKAAGNSEGMAPTVPPKKTPAVNGQNMNMQDMNAQNGAAQDGNR